MRATFLLKYRLLKAPIHPFVAGGVSYRRNGQGAESSLSQRTGPLVPGEVVDHTQHRTAFSQPAENSAGGVAAGGIEFRLGRLRLAPEVRYTRWQDRYWDSYGSRGYFTASNLNQVELLFGLTF